MPKRHLGLGSDLAVANALSKGGKNSAMLRNILKTSKDVRKINRITNVLSRDLELSDTSQVSEFVTALSLLEDTLRTVQKSELKRLLLVVRKVIIQMIVDEAIPEFLSYPPLNEEYVLREKYGLDEYSFFYNSQELITEGVVFSVDENDNIDISPAQGIHSKSKLTYFEMFQRLENGFATIPPRPFFSVIVVYAEDILRKLLLEKGWEV